MEVAENKPEPGKERAAAAGLCLFYGPPQKLATPFFLLSEKERKIYFLSLANLSNREIMEEVLEQDELFRRRGFHNPIRK